MKANKLEEIWRYIRVGEPDECWEWTMGTWNNGYPRYTLNGKSKSAHRLVYEMEHGQIERDVFIRQKCNNKICCNPKHLVAVDGPRQSKWVF